MECPACGATNGGARKFCRACGARLPVRCGTCGTANESDDRFCGECGAPLGVAPPAPDPVASPTTPAAASEERRYVTVLFADLVGFTSLSERLDAEEVRDITTDCLRQLAAEAVRFEGTVDKLIGDAVMILFGAPVAHEDDPARALRAALAMQRALERFNERLERTHGLALRLRIGVESGEVVAGPREVGGMVEYTVIGDAVNVAARLQTAAEPGTVVVGEATSQRAGSGFRLRAGPPLTLKGRARPVAASVLLGEAIDQPSVEPLVALVGRSAELRDLLGRLEALRAGRGGAVAIIGAPGLGKSRLLAELRARASVPGDAGGALSWVRCQAYAHEHRRSYGLVQSLVRALAAIGPDEHDGTALAQLQTVLESLGLAGEEAVLVRLLGLASGMSRASSSAPPSGEGAPEGADGGDALAVLSPQDLHHRYFAAVSALVEAMAACGPLVLEVDDLHWADPTSVDLLLELLLLARRTRLLLCLAFRPERDAACQLLRDRGEWHLGEQYVEFMLRPLSEAASAELAARLLGLPVDGAAALPPALRALLERAAGTPLWLEELMRTLVERGILAAGEGGLRVQGNLDAVELPGTLQALIVARIDRLGPARPTLQVASVIGRRFGRAVLERVAGATGRLDTDLESAQQADLVRELSARSEREYDFKHVLVRDAAYATLLHRRRRALHAQVADAIERLYPERASELHAVLAYHYERAGAWHPAYRHARAAAETARDSFANREALECYTLALHAAERGGLGDDVRCLLVEARGSVHERLGDFEAARADYEAALALAESPTPGDSAARIRILGALGMLWAGHKDYQRGVDLTRRAVEAAAASGDARAQAGASVQLGILHLNLMRFGEGRSALEAARVLHHQLGDALGEARTLDALGLLTLCDGRLEVAGGYLRDAHDRLSELGDRGGAVSSGTMLGIPLLMGGCREEGERWMRRVLDVAEELGMPSAESFAWMILAEGLDPYGAYTRADVAAQRALAIAREIDHREWTLAAYGPIGRIRRARGDLDGALRLHREMLEIARDVGSALWTTEALSNVAFDSLVAGNLEDARTYSAEAVERGGQYQKGLLNAWLTRIHLLLVDGRPEGALAETRATLTLGQDFRVRTPEFMVLAGVVLEALGRVDEAAAMYREALSAARAVGAAVGLWQAGQRLGDVLDAKGRGDESALLRAAVDADIGRLAVDFGEAGLRQTLAAQPWLPVRPGAG